MHKRNPTTPLDHIKNKLSSPQPTHILYTEIKLFFMKSLFIIFIKKFAR